MAELAGGAVSSLLGVIRNEAVLLRRVGGDVQFIKEEMESMNSFLAHLARSAPAGGEHEEQVRTWMNQVRLLAQDCNNCIDIYLYRGNPDIHRAKGGIWRYLWWVPWFLQKLAAQHSAAEQLGQLRVRARDVGERRLRYGVQVPPDMLSAGKSPSDASLNGTPSSSARPASARGYAAGDNEEDGDDQLMVATAMDHSGQRAFFEPRSLDDYVKAKLWEWLDGVPKGAHETMSIAIVAPDRVPAALTIAREVLVSRPGYDKGRYHQVVLVDIPAVHPDFLPLRPKEVLFYILRELKLERSKNQSQKQGQGTDELDQSKNQSQEQGTDGSKGKEENLDPEEMLSDIYWEKKEMLGEIKEKIVEMKIYEKLNKIKSDILVPLLKDHEQKKDVDQLDPALFYQGLFPSQQDQVKIKEMYKLRAWTEKVITKIAKDLKEHMEVDENSNNLKEETRVLQGEAGEGEREEEEEEDEGRGGGGEEQQGGDEEQEECQNMTPIHLDEAQYARILRAVFSKTSSNNPLQAQQQDRSAAKQDTKNTLGEDQINQMIQEATRGLREDMKQKIDKMKQEIKEQFKIKGLVDKDQATGEPGTPSQATGETDTQGRNREALFEDTEQKIYEMKQEFKEQFKIKGLVDNIQHELLTEKRRRAIEDKYYPLFIIKVDETMDISIWEDTINTLSLLKCSSDVLIVTTTEDIQEAKGYCHPRQEPIDYSLVGLYYDTVLNLTIDQKNEDNYKYKPQMFHDILEECAPHEFCMKIFTHALYLNPKRSNEELRKLYNDLKGPKSDDTIAKKMLKFSYSDLPKEYKSCLLYLAIFPPKYKIRRSTLIGRWVAEGMIYKDDWPSSVRQANRCFDALINGWLAYPVDIGATGKVNSCEVSEEVHGFITKIARKQHIVETRLSHHLARHFSIFNDLQLRSSDRISTFFENLSKSSRVSLLKVLDLEGSECFGVQNHGVKNQHYLRVICTKMLLLKYLSLRGTDITQLPSEINQLRELEVLDIRETNVPKSVTANIMLLKLKRLLAGHIDPSPSNSVSSVHIPNKIDKMVNIEVLSNVEAQNSHELKDIGKLWHLRKLGVVIVDKNSHLKNLLQSISDLHECLCSLSITLNEAPRESASSGEDLPLDHPPKLLESLTISGTTQKVHLLQLFYKDGTSLNKLVKVTLISTSLNTNSLEVLAKVPMLRCIRLRNVTCTESTLTIKDNKFNNLRDILVEGSNFTKIIFFARGARLLEKIVLSSTKIVSVAGVSKLKKLEEVELDNCNIRLLSSFEGAKQVAKLILRGIFVDEGEESKITFNKDGFPKLNHLVVHCSVISRIVFNSGSAPKLEKIVLSSTNTVLYVSGVSGLEKLEEVELENSSSRLLSSFEKGKQIAKLTLHGTLVHEGASKITFSKAGFPELNHLVVHSSAITEIAFNKGSAPKLEKIVWSSASLSGIKNLPNLKDLQFIGDRVPDMVKKDIEEHKNEPVLKYISKQ